MIPIGVAAGHVKRIGDLEPLLRVPTDILRSITLGSYTLKPREGNPGNAFWTDDRMSATSINSLGLPNPGSVGMHELLDALRGRAGLDGRLLRVSIAGFSPNEYRLLAKDARRRDVWEIELNLGCPNVLTPDGPKPIPAFSPDLIKEILMEVYRETDDVGAPRVAVKLSPYSDPQMLERVAEVIIEMKRAIQTVVTCNTFPNASGFNEDSSSAISAANGYGGLAGAAMKHIALGQVRKFRELLPSEIKIVGVGGISSGQDVLDMEWAGASSVQIGTAFFGHSDPGIFQRIMAEYVDLL